MHIHPSVTAAKRDNQIREGEVSVVGVQEEDVRVLDGQALDVPYTRQNGSLKL